MIRQRFCEERFPNRFGSEENSQLQRHIEPRQLVRLPFDFGSRNIVDTVIALINQTINILDSNFACIGELQCASRDKSTFNNAKHGRVEKRLILPIEWTINEYASAGGRWHLLQLCLTTK